MFFKQMCQLGYNGPMCLQKISTVFSLPQSNQLPRKLSSHTALKRKERRDGREGGRKYLRIRHFLKVMQVIKF